MPEKGENVSSSSSPEKIKDVLKLFLSICTRPLKSETLRGYALQTLTLIQIHSVIAVLLIKRAIFASTKNLQKNCNNIQLSQVSQKKLIWFNYCRCADVHIKDVCCRTWRARIVSDTFWGISLSVRGGRARVDTENRWWSLEILIIKDHPYYK